MDDVERAARALCKVDGVDPDKGYQTGRMETVRGPNSVEMRPVTEPEWRKRIPEAQRFVAMLNALTADLSEKQD